MAAAAVIVAAAAAAFVLCCAREKAFDHIQANSYYMYKSEKPSLKAAAFRLSLPLVHLSFTRGGSSEENKRQEDISTLKIVDYTTPLSFV